ncbi:hypothetical protein Pmani_025412 [Petrolisthes manimaculis]|uniref:Protein quiver n=1 Tax=Petrolisthes manimaculis TaxID=1843537 RepID=A0AAE1P5K6_9EUCA|nr:hypothetical protein Pmani_025412 [Petrolisthes manimaculis]
MAGLQTFGCQMVVLVAALYLICITSGTRGISCYVCSSKNRSDINCEDPYHPAYSTFAQDCKVPKQDHIGKFPANYCVKIIGTSAVNGESLMIRTCVLENMDSQCGVFKFGGEQLTGCILTCRHDGCNPAPPSPTAPPKTLVFSLPFLLPFVAAPLFLYR